jgi:UTP-glucose-1-phosphate uridylyltransferase
VAAMMLPDNIILDGEGLGDLMDYQPEEDEVVWGKTMVSRRAAHYFGNSGDYRPVEPKPTDVESVVGLQPKEEGYFVDRDLEWPAPRLIGRVLLPPRFFEIAQSADPDPRTGELDDVPIFRRLLESRPGRAIPVSGDVYDAGEPDNYLRLAADYFQRSGVRHDD